MSNSPIESLTPEQEAKIPVYQEKWRAIALYTERIDKKKAAEAVKALYTTQGMSTPRIVVVNSPYPVLSAFSWLDLMRENFKWVLLDKVKENLSYDLWFQLWIKLQIPLERTMLHHLYLALMKNFSYHLSMGGQRFYSENSSAAACCFIDFCISVLNCPYPSEKWEIFQEVVKECGWVFPLKKNLAFICNRPFYISLDSEQLLHAEGEPALIFADGFSLYFHHGVIQTETDGKQPLINNNL